MHLYISVHAHTHKNLIAYQNAKRQLFAADAPSVVADGLKSIVQPFLLAGSTSPGVPTPHPATTSASATIGEYFDFFCLL